MPRPLELDIKALYQDLAMQWRELGVRAFGRIAPAQQARDEAQRIAANIAELPDSLRQ